MVFLSSATSNIRKALLGKKPNMAKNLRDMKRNVNAYLDKNDESGFGKFVKGFTTTAPEKEDKKESNGHVPVGYDRLKPYYISPSVNRRPHMFSQEVANEWRRHRQHIGEISANPNEQDKKNKPKFWKKWHKKKKGNKKGKKDTKKKNNK